MTTLRYQDAQAEIHQVVVGPMDNNVYVVRCRETGDAVLIDAANEHEQLLELCATLGVRKVIETFARFGAPDRILIEGKPHIGSDLLPFAVERLRNELIARGCEVRFETRVEDLLYADGAVAGVKLSDGSSLESDRVVLAPGNSARELYERFAADGRVFVEARPFALGFRAEHPQSFINEIQYGAKAAKNTTNLMAIVVRVGRALVAFDVDSFSITPASAAAPPVTASQLMPAVHRLQRTLARSR